ncbi:MAG: hypothetical protein R6V47_00540 [Candidatus Delongbacteria bacterium]
MKNISIFFSIMTLAFTLTASGFAEELFFNIHPGAKTEAMGKTSSVTCDGMFSVSANPALLSRSENITVSVSRFSPYSSAEGYKYEGSEYNYAGAGFSLGSKLAFGLSMKDLSYGEDVELLDADSSFVANYEPFVKNYALNLTFRPTPFLSLGVGGNFYELNNAKNAENENNSAFSLDLGVQSVVNVQKGTSLRKKSSIGVAVKNAYGQEIEGQELPSIISAGVEFALIPMVRNPLSSNLWLLFLTLNADYQSQMNGDHSKFSTGFEFLLTEMAALRCGYYRQEYEEDIKSESEFTYGFGLNLPLYRLDITDIPLKLSLNYVSVSAVENISLTVSWMSKRDY